MSDQATGFWTVVLVLYFLPSIIALLRRHQVMAIILLNLLLGWTALGWIVALVWSVAAKQRAVNVNISSTVPEGGYVEIDGVTYKKVRVERPTNPP